MNIEKYLISEDINEGIIKVLSIIKDALILINNLSELKNPKLSELEKKEIIDNNLPRIMKLLKNSSLKQEHKNMIIAGLRSIPNIQGSPIYKQISSRYIE
jgi:hypothetical protein